MCAYIRVIESLLRVQGLSYSDYAASTDGCRYELAELYGAAADSFHVACVLGHTCLQSYLCTHTPSFAFSSAPHHPVPTCTFIL